jgi:uncharacterized membrane protein (DUF373 family)
MVGPLIAIARKVIILEVKDLEPLVLMGIASIILALALGYYYVKMAIQLKGASQEARERIAERLSGLHPRHGKENRRR